MDGSIYLAEVTRRFREAESQCERALAQVPFERWSERLDPGSNSLVTLVQHLAGNMLSRFTEFLTTDGEKPDRDRDAEFEDPATLDEAALRDRLRRGWATVFEAIGALRDEDLGRTVTIRGEPHSVLGAIERQVAHYAYHTGQVVFLAKHLAGDRFQTLSVARGGTKAFNEAMLAKAREPG
jgi:hypothetical protein